jgi:hypothetical protein
MAHPDKCWRVAAIYRCCIRYNKDMQWAHEKLSEMRILSSDGNVIAGHSFPRLAQIWFQRETPRSINHIEQQRHEYRRQKVSA